MESDPAATPTESTMVRYFKNNLIPSIKAKMNQDATHLDNYEELVAKAVRAKAKAGLQLSSYVREIDQQVLQESRPVHSTTHKFQTQEPIKDHCRDEFRDKVPMPASTLDSEPSNKAKKDKK